MTPVFTGRVLPGGLLVLDRPGDYLRHVRSLHGRFVEVIVRKQHVQRSQRANNFYWAAVVPAIAEYCGYEPDEMHEVLAMKFLRIEDDPTLGVPRRKRTPDLSTEDFAEYVNQCIRFAATELGVVIPEPQTVDAT